MKKLNLKESSYSDYIAFADDSATFEEFLQKVKEQGLEGELPEEELKKIYTAHKDLNMKPTQVTEVLPKDADAGEYIADFEKSKAPQFKGKSKKKRKEMAIAAFMNKQEKMKKEDILQAVKEVLAEKKATYCGRCGHTHVKGTPCPRPFKEGLSPYGDDAYFVTPNKGKKMTKEDILKIVKEVLAENVAYDIESTDGTKTVQSFANDAEATAFKSTNTNIKAVKKLEEDDWQDPTDESSMAKSELYSIAKYAIELMKMIEDGEQLDAWVQSKITKAADYVNSVKRYMEGEKAMGIEEKLDPVGHEDEDVDNDGKKNTKTDKYIKNKRVKIGAAIAQAKKK